jgi:hypothetical protein
MRARVWIFTALVALALAINLARVSLFSTLASRPARWP